MSSNSKSLVVFLFYSSDEDLIFLGQASMGIKKDMQKKKEIFHVRNKHVEKL